VTRARTNADNVTADIAGITAGTGITGGGTSGTVTITNDMATTIAAKGDLLAGTANDAYSALTVGANGTVLTAASGQATGLEWAAPSTPTLNEQRFTTSGTFTVPTGVTKVWVTAVGGGGGGNSSGGGGYTYAMAFGGFAGAYITEQITVTPAAAITVTVGSGGSASGAGNSSSFGSLTANGGAAGQGAPFPGGSDRISTNGQSGYGIGGVGSTSGTGGAAAANSGAGGGAGNSGGSGGAGGSGIVIVRWL
jgi:hypothetical protein